ncbi:hypothetical protein EK21DRAFT_76014 [Setomelanomma holmii]|uniref:Heterokaryon incompatibility domain-containing protein n=1 Tax=Setomelanomma holmii TaxID=210430 RepID=A0A9P4H104_9PLEO|nr:hypothetical protein EK21DRAFT_76014 [Setomelanomma holmii]
MSDKACLHPDIWKFDGLRCCLACGETVFETSLPKPALKTYPCGPTRYEYVDLNYTLGLEIRLCILLPGEPDDPLRCEIIHVNLEDEPEFEAVSYTWAGEDGDASLSHSIDCGNNNLVPITVNCQAVLRQLKQRGLRRRLWIDAICINQSRISERNHQVGLMDRVYSQAQRVRISITDRSIPAVNYRKLFYALQTGSTQQLEWFRTWRASLPFVILGVYGQDYLRHDSRPRLLLIPQTPTQVIQEVVLARTAYLLVNEHEILLSPEVLDSLNGIAMRHSCPLPGVLSSRWKAGQRPLADITDCLRAGLDGECADPRDKIFAVQSFMDPMARSFISIDYSLKPIEVYARAVIAVVATQRNLDVIFETNFGPYDWVLHSSMTLTLDDIKKYLAQKDSGTSHGKSQAKSISHGHDWRQFTHSEIGPWHATVEVLSAKELPLIPSQSAKTDPVPVVFGQTLRVQPCDNILPHFHGRAHYIDTINKAYIKPDSAPYRADAREMASIWKSHMAECPGHRKLPMDDWLVPYFLRRSTGHLSADSASQMAQYLGQHRRDPHVVHLQDLNDFLDTNISLGQFKRLFSTTNSVGFARPGFKLSDEVWAIDGARAPFILRRIADEQYSIVSECYLWAALELDYWDPGTKKGRWSENRQPHHEEQTRIIAIY